VSLQFLFLNITVPFDGQKPEAENLLNIIKLLKQQNHSQASNQK